MSRRYDAVAIGSGINSLVAAALLAKAGWSVCVLERNDWLGGAIRTAEITEPGLRARGARGVASALHRLGRVRGARRTTSRRVGWST